MPIALVVTSIVLRDRAVRTRHKIDYLGAVLLLVGVSGLLLVTTLGGSPQGYAWLSPQIVAMVVIGIAFVAGFLIREHYASEPIVPLRLFRKRVFSVANAAGFHRRRRHVRRDHLLARVPPGRPRSVANHLWAHAVAHHGRACLRPRSEAARSSHASDGTRSSRSWALAS